MEDVDKYFEKYNDIENLILENKIQDEEDILINLKDDLKTIDILLEPKKKKELF